jgi:predicted metal-binding membrane protein
VRVGRLIARGPVLTLAGVLALCVLAWVYLAREAADMADMAGMADMMDMPGMDMPGMGTVWTVSEWGYLCVMWSVMMVAMMLPSAMPTILLFARLPRPGATPAFVAGYLIAWTAYSVLAATAQWVLHGMLLVSDAMVSASPVLSGALLVAAGVFQFTPLKARCVTHCRSPLSFLTQHWREGTAGALRMGLHHGTYCVGCCWALMALLFVLGVMNLLWVTGLAVLVLLEKTLPAGRWLTWATGGALMAWGALVLWGTW